MEQALVFALMVDDEHAVIYVYALNQYCLPLFEDEGKIALLENIQLWKQIANSKWFLRTPMFVVLNKCDLFKESLRYWMNLVYKDGVEFIKNKFIEIKSDIQIYEICAIDTNQVDEIMKQIQQEISVRITHS